MDGSNEKAFTTVLVNGEVAPDFVAGKGIRWNLSSSDHSSLFRLPIDVSSTTSLLSTRLETLGSSGAGWGGGRQFDAKRTLAESKFL